MFPLYLVPGQAPPFQDTASFVDYWTRINGIVLTRVLLDILECVCLLVFAAGLRHLIRQRSTEYEWIGTLVLGAALSLSTFTLVAASLEGGLFLASATPSMAFSCPSGSSRSEDKTNRLSRPICFVSLSLASNEIVSFSKAIV